MTKAGRESRLSDRCRRRKLPQDEPIPPSSPASSSLSRLWYLSFRLVCESLVCWPPHLLCFSHQKAFCVYCKTISFAPGGLWTKLYCIPTMYGCWDIVGILLIAWYSWVTCFPLELAMWSYISAIFYGQMNNDRMPEIQQGFITQMRPIIDSSHAANTC